MSAAPSDLPGSGHRALRTRHAVAVVVGAALCAVLGISSPSSASAATTQRASCVDGSGITWRARTTWKSEYRAADGVRRVAIDDVQWTTTAGVLPTDSRVSTFDGRGARVQRLAWTGTFNYQQGTRHRDANSIDPTHAPGRSTIRLTLGRDGDGHGDCTMTFRQPATTAAPAPTDLDLWRTPQPQNTITGRGAAFDAYKVIPTFIWQGDWNRRPRTEVARWASSARAAGEVLPLTLYAFPRSGYSAGGINSLGEYTTWIDDVSAGIGAARAIVVVEPDALYLPNRMKDGTSAQVAIRYAVQKLSRSNPNTAVYLESSYWFDSAVQSQRLLAAGVAQTAGFVMNVSSFETTAEVAKTGEAVTRDLARHGVPGKKYLIDTGRNGNGPLTADFGPGGEPWLTRHLEWLNPPGRGLGLSPRKMHDPAFPNFAAAVWVKPPGATDGQDPGTTWHASYFDEPAPADGQFWLAWMEDALVHTDMDNLR